MNLKHTLLTLTALLSCSTTYAKRDYDQYPQHKEEIALYNLTEIAKNVCNEGQLFRTIPNCESMKFNQREFEYKYLDCSFWVNRPISTASGGQTSRECGSRSYNNYTFRWDEITKIVPGSRSVKICIKDKEDCLEMNVFSNEQQAYDFAEALNIYRKSRKEE